MDINNFIEKKKMLQAALIDYIDCNTSQMEENFQNVTTIVNEQNIRKDKQEFKLLIYLISHIANNHHRSSQFIAKIEKVLLAYKKEISQFFTNKEIFAIFQGNKRVLLFLFKQKILVFDALIENTFKSAKCQNESYKDYFAPEINNCGKNAEKLKTTNEFEENRSKGENDNNVCKLIRNDQVNEFKANITKSKISLTSKIMPSIFETNSFLLQNKPTLIEYAAFFGSLNVFKYLLMNGVKLTPSIWVYAIHGNNFELLHILEEKCPLSNEKVSEQCLVESIKCHHNDIANYFLTNLKIRNSNNLKNEASIENYNFSFFPNSFNENFIANLLCEFDHYSILKMLLNIRKLDNIKLLEIAKKKNLSDIAKLLLLSTPDDVEVIKGSTLNSPELTPFTVWEQRKDGKIRLTKEASKRISSSNNPCLVLEFGLPRNGKSTIASHLSSGPEPDLSRTIFKTAASTKSCTHLIHGVGPIKCKEFASLFGINLSNISNNNKNRDIFIIDSEGLNSIDGETIWLKQAIISTLPLSTVSLYVSIAINKSELDSFMKYLRLVRVIGGVEIHHGLAYVHNKATYDGSNVMEQLMAENVKNTTYLIKEFQKSSITIDDSHFKCFSVVSFDKHKSEYSKSIAEISKFIINICLNEGTVLSGPMIVNMLEEMADKTTQISDFTDINKSFEIIFNQVLENAMKKSIDEQIPQIEFDITKNLTNMSIQELKILDINNYMKKMENSEFTKKIISKAVEKTLPDLQQSFPIIYKNSQSEIIKIIRNIIEDERSKLMSKDAMEIYNLGRGFSISEGIFKKKIFALPFSPKYVEKRLSNNVMFVCHIPEKAVLEPVAFDLQKSQKQYNSTLDNLITTIASSFNNDSNIGLNHKKLSFSALSKFALNLFGFSYSMLSPQNNATSSLSVNLLGKVFLKEEKNMEQYFAQDLQKKLNKLEIELNRCKNDVKSPQVKEIISKIYSNYGESVAMGFFIGNYELDINYSNNQSIMSGGLGGSSSNNNSSTDIGVSVLKIGASDTNQSLKGKATHSEVVSATQNQSKITCGSSSKPSIFMYDIASSFVGNTSVKSSFIPIFQLVKSKSVANALKYWAGRWNAKPETYSEYCYVNDIKSIPVGQQIQLYHDNRPYDVNINKNSDIVIPNSKIEYTGTNHLTYDVVLDPEKMTIGGFNSDVYVYHYINHHRRFWKHTTREYKHQALEVQLSPFWAFDQDINGSIFKGDNLQYMKLSNISSRSFKAEYSNYDTGTGRKWKTQNNASIQQNLKVKLV